jgi:CHASE1-domain containing sensor protein
MRTDGNGNLVMNWRWAAVISFLVALLSSMATLGFRFGSQSSQLRQCEVGLESLDRRMENMERILMENQKQIAAIQAKLEFLTQKRESYAP